ncbi:MAG: hypothetical protein AB7L76_05545 [Burkholderiaceae bacterium]
MNERIEDRLAALNRRVFELQEIGQGMAEEANTPEEISEALRGVAGRLNALADEVAR